MRDCWEHQRNLGVIQFFLVEVTFREYAEIPAVLWKCDGLEERVIGSGIKPLYFLSSSCVPDCFAHLDFSPVFQQGS